MRTSIAIPQAREDKLQLAQAFAIRAKRANKSRTVYGIYRPNGGMGGELVKCVQEQEGEWVEVDKPVTVKVPEKLERLLTTKKRFKIAFGGRSGAKSNTFGDIFAARAKDYGDKTMCLRELQNSIDDSVHALLKTEIDRLGFDNFDITNNAIRLNSEDVFKFKGLARNPDAVKSMFGFKFGWGEEAQALSEESLRMLTPTIREKDSELWFSLNPGSSEDAFSRRFLEPFYSELLANGFYEDDLHLIVWINYEDNPWHSKELEQERKWDKKNLSRNLYDHIWHGHYNDEVENALIVAEWFDACIDAHTKIGFQAIGAKYASHDPSDLGPDSKGYAMRHGSVITHIEEKIDGTANEGARWACDLAISHGVDHFTWDGDGLGSPLREQIAKSFRGKATKVDMFRGSESPDNAGGLFDSGDKHPIGGVLLVKDAVKNKRAQYYAELRRRVYNTYRAVEHNEYCDPDDMISFSSSITVLNKVRSEICRLPIKPNGNGKIELYTKDVMKQRFKLNSPNLGDSIMMLMRAVTIQAVPQSYSIPDAVNHYA
jgi:phage terminase large subunit